MNIQNITKTIGDKVLFENISFKIGEGQKVGLVGPNGTGKTTLLNIIAGKEQADSGIVSLANEQIGYLPQKLVTSPHEEIGHFLTQFLSEDWEHYKIDTVLAQVGLKAINTKTLIAKLSGGQKMKIGLTALLLKEPTMLLLDEPTNNLDVRSLQWLEQFVQSFPGKVLVVSHDRFFLDACVNKIIELDPFTHQIAEYGGNYSDYKLQKQQRQQNLLSDYERQQEKEQRMHDWIVEKQQQLKYHPSNKVARQLQSMKTRFEREIVQERIEKPKNYNAFSISQFGGQLHAAKSVFSLQDVAIYGLFKVKELYISGDERIHLQGENGVGKTTFLKSLLGELAVHTGTIHTGESVKRGYFSQEHEALEAGKTVLQVFMHQTKLFDESIARGILGKFLFTKQKVFSRVEYLSEGEKARLLIAVLIHQQNDFLLLDEPTNHLDLESREVLAEALRGYEGGFLVISHDRYFLKQIHVQRVIKIKDGQILG
jgi:ATP-binding cassette subfamily F protein 3